MDTKSASILGICIVIAATILTLRPAPMAAGAQPEVSVEQVIGRFQVSNPGETGVAYVIDTVDGRVWREVVNMSGATDGQRFYQQKLLPGQPNQPVGLTP